MIKKVCVVGYKGNMGRRYCSILDYLKIPYQGIDLHNSSEDIQDDVEGFLICTPTALHFDSIVEFSGYDLPILCEKPLTKSRDEFENLMSMTIELSMINQYRDFFVPKIGPTTYEFYNSGGDGLLWDCANLVGMANGSISLQKTGPHWSCMINGVEIDYRDIGKSYVNNIANWLTGNFVESKRYIIKTHERLFNYAEKLNGCNWDTSKEIFITPSGEINKTFVR